MNCTKWQSCFCNRQSKIETNILIILKFVHLPLVYQMGMKYDISLWFDNLASPIGGARFMNNGKSPILYKDGVGQYDASNQLIQEFICKYDVLRKLHMSDKTMAKALDKEVAYNGFYYRSIGYKLSVFPK